MSERLATACPHPGRPVASRQMCEPCYRQKKRRGEHLDYPTGRSRGPHRDELIAEVEFLMPDSPEQIARRLGKSVGAIARALYRLGRPDLARPFQRQVKRDWSEDWKRQKRRLVA